MADHRTRRVKILQVDPRLIVDLLNGIRQHEFVCLPVTDNIPEGTEVLAIHENWSTRRMEFLITHDSFPEVPDGDVPPYLPESIEYRTMRPVPMPCITAEKYREAERLVNAMISPLEGCVSPEFAEWREKLLCDMAERKSKFEESINREILEPLAACIFTEHKADCDLTV